MKTSHSASLLLYSSLALFLAASNSAIANNSASKSASDNKPQEHTKEISKAATKSTTHNTDVKAETDTAPATDIQLEFPQYQDDRSTPSKLIESYYNAINRKEIARAYSYYSEEGRDPFYDTYAKGYSDTKSVKLILGTPQADPGAGTFYWSQPLALEAEDNEGKTEIFTGCYTIRMLNPAMQEIPPFKPMEIMTGTLSLSPLDLEKSVPDNCDAP